MVRAAIVMDRDDGPQLLTAYGSLCELEGRRMERYKHWKQLVNFHAGVLTMMEAYKALRNGEGRREIWAVFGNSSSSLA